MGKNVNRNFKWESDDKYLVYKERNKNHMLLRPPKWRIIDQKKVHDYIKFDIKWKLGEWMEKRLDQCKERKVGNDKLVELGWIERKFIEEIEKTTGPERQKRLDKKFIDKCQKLSKENKQLKYNFIDEKKMHKPNFYKSDKLSQ